MQGSDPLGFGWESNPDGALSNTASVSSPPPLPVEALFGRAPFASRSYAELEEKIRSDRPIEVSGAQQAEFSQTHRPGDAG